MSLAKDPETLRVPAFMRKRGLANRSRRPLLLTALDRKNAGVLPEGVKAAAVKLKKVRKERKMGKVAEKNIRMAQLQNSLLDFLETEPVARSYRPAPRRKTLSRAKRVAPKLMAKKAKKIKKTVSIFAPPVFESFSEPIIGGEISQPVAAKKKAKVIGIITHYYDKIKVGVIKLSGTLCVGDTIVYETDEGPAEQVVESMEIDREPVFKAGKGKEVGIKLNKKSFANNKVFLK